MGVDDPGCLLNFDDFRKEVLCFLNSNQWKQQGFENMLTDKFQIIKPDFSGSYLNGMRSLSDIFKPSDQDQDNDVHDRPDRTV